MKSKVKKVLSKFKKVVKEPVYIPVMSGELLKGETVLVTGGTGGIGMAIAKRCIENGATVIITGRNQEKLNKAVQQIHAIPFVLDIQDVSGMQSAFSNMVQKYKIDTLINNAGLQAGAQLGNTKEKDFDETLSTNLKGTYFLSQIFSNYLLKLRT